MICLTFVDSVFLELREELLLLLTCLGLRSTSTLESHLWVFFVNMRATRALLKQWATLDAGRDEPLHLARNFGLPHARRVDTEASPSWRRVLSTACFGIRFRCVVRARLASTRLTDVELPILSQQRRLSTIWRLKHRLEGRRVRLHVEEVAGRPLVARLCSLLLENAVLGHRLASFSMLRGGRAVRLP